MAVEYREEPCRAALNRVKGMGFKWSLNPYMGCVHRCTFCYVRGFELRADRPSDDRYGRSIRVKVNVVDVLRQELQRPSWKREQVAIGAATDPYQPAEGRYRLMPGILAALYALLGDRDRAFALLEQAYAEKDWTLREVNLNPMLDPLRGDPRFTKLLKKLNLG